MATGDGSMTHLSHPCPTMVGHGASRFDVAFRQMSHLTHLRSTPVRGENLVCWKSVQYTKICGRTVHGDLVGHVGLLSLSASNLIGP